MGDPLATKIAPVGTPPLQRFMRFVLVDGVTGCWLWTGALRAGYGQFQVDGGPVPAHRWIYEQAIGPIPEALCLDHFQCDTPRCVNPAHLRAVTPRENTLRGNSPAAWNAGKTHCLRGHLFDAENTGRFRDGSRFCVKCQRDKAREWRVAQREKV